MCLNRVAICTQCRTDTNGLMMCQFPTGDEPIYLCPDCLRKDGNFCFCCGMFSSGLQSFDFIHPGYCDTCWDEIENEVEDWEEYGFLK